jgi:hypothetical protein
MQVFNGLMQRWQLCRQAMVLFKCVLLMVDGRLKVLVTISLARKGAPVAPVQRTYHGLRERGWVILIARLIVETLTINPRIEVLQVRACVHSYLLNDGELER